MTPGVPLSLSYLVFDSRCGILVPWKSTYIPIQKMIQGMTRTMPLGTRIPLPTSTSAKVRDTTA